MNNLVEIENNNKNELSTHDVKQQINLDRYMRLVHAKLGKNSKAALEQDLKFYIIFTEQNNLAPFPTDLMFAGDQLLKYVEHLVDAQYAKATIQRKLSSVRKFFRIMQIGDPIAKDEIFSDSLKHTYKQLSASKQKPPIRFREISELPIPDNSSSLTEVRNFLILYLGIYTLCRASDLLLIKVKDIDLVDGTALVFDRKTDKENTGRYVGLSKNTVKLLSIWLERTDLEPNDLLLQKVYQNGKTPKHKLGLSYPGIVKLVKSMGKKYGFKSDIAMHSLRIGGAVSLAEMGVSLPEITHAGGWKSGVMPIQYTRQIDAKKTGTSRFKE